MNPGRRNTAIAAPLCPGLIRIQPLLGPQATVWMAVGQREEIQYEYEAQSIDLPTYRRTDAIVLSAAVLVLVIVIEWGSDDRGCFCS